MTEITKYTTSAGQHAPLAVVALSSKAARTIELYKTELGKYLDAGHAMTDRAALRAYGESLSPGRARTFKSAVALWANETTKALDGQVTPKTWIEIQATKARLLGLADQVQTEPPKGEKAHTWLSRAQVHDLRAALDGDDILTVRDRVIIGLMVSCGLRRAEVTSVTWSDLVVQPGDDGDMITVLSILGKGNKRRTIPIPHALKRDLDAWAAWTGRDGLIVRRLGRSLDVLGAGISAVSVHRIVKKYGALAGIANIAAHDLRRTAAQGWYSASNHDIVLVSRLLGHASVETTQRYLEIGTTDAIEVINSTAWGTDGR